jgi:hypothetical protein
LTNGQSYSTSELTGPQGEQGTQGEKGDKGDQGIQGVQGVQGVPGPNMIVAMGVINQSAQIVEGYNVTSCEWTSSYYLIGLTGITYDESHYVTAVTPIWSSNEHFPVITSVEGKLIVGLIDTTGTPGKGSFSFMVLEFP